MQQKLLSAHFKTGLDFCSLLSYVAKIIVFTLKTDWTMWSSIKDIWFFWPFFDLPTYPSLLFSYSNYSFSIAISDFWKPTYLSKVRTSFVDTPLQKKSYFHKNLKSTAQYKIVKRGISERNIQWSLFINISVLLHVESHSPITL